MPSAFITPVTGTFGDAYQGYLKSWVFLANAYVDLGTWDCLTPFVGAGVGGAYNHDADLIDIGIGTTRRRLRPQHQQRGAPAWALYAGVAYNVTQNFKVDLAYRYLNYGSVTDTDRLHRRLQPPTPTSSATSPRRTSCSACAGSSRLERDAGHDAAAARRSARAVVRCHPRLIDHRPLEEAQTARATAPFSFSVPCHSTTHLGRPTSAYATEAPPLARRSCRPAHGVAELTLH